MMSLDMIYCENSVVYTKQNRRLRINLNLKVIFSHGKLSQILGDPVQTTVSFCKDASKTLLVECSNANCSSLDPRLKVIRSVGRFDITISLHNLNKSDSGNYIASADIRRPSNMMRVCIFKNFSLNVIDPAGRTKG